MYVCLRVCVCVFSIFNSVLRVNLDASPPPPPLFPAFLTQLWPQSWLFFSEGEISLCNLDA